MFPCNKISILWMNKNGLWSSNPGSSTYHLDWAYYISKTFIFSFIKFLLNYIWIAIWDGLKDKGSVIWYVEGSASFTVELIVPWWGFLLFWVFFPHQQSWNFDSSTPSKNSFQFFGNISPLQKNRKNSTMSIRISFT